MAPAGVQKWTGVAFVEVLVEVSASVSLLIVRGASEMGGGTAIIDDSWITPSSVDARISVDTSAICSSCVDIG
jgi:hypothetical protein